MTMKNLTKEAHFATEVIGLLLGQEYVEQLVGAYRRRHGLSFVIVIGIYRDEIADMRWFLFLSKRIIDCGCSSSRIFVVACPSHGTFAARVTASKGH